MIAPIDQLRQRLHEMGATLVAEDDGGAFSQETYRLVDLRLCLTVEYGSWRLTASVGAGAFYPLSFWMAALDGEDAFPEPAVGVEDVGKVANRLPELVARAADVSPAVAGMGADYSRATRDRLT